MHWPHHELALRFEEKSKVFIRIENEDIHHHHYRWTHFLPSDIRSANKKTAWISDVMIYSPNYNENDAALRHTSNFFLFAVYEWERERKESSPYPVKRNMCALNPSVFFIAPNSQSFAHQNVKTETEKKQQTCQRI